MYCAYLDIRDFLLHWPQVHAEHSLEYRHERALVFGGRRGAHGRQEQDAVRDLFETGNESGETWDDAFVANAAVPALTAKVVRLRWTWRRASALPAGERANERK